MKNSDKPILKVLTCGSVDDGKSTLVGRLLFEQESVFEDELAALDRDTRKCRGEAEIDYAFLLDGLAAEREQGITIDVAYRYFDVNGRSFIFADTPGHEQYTCNMVTGASNSKLAILLVDARKGLGAQTYRHAHIVSLMGIKHVVLAVNKIDLVQFDSRVFETIRNDFERLAGPLGFAEIRSIPLSARYGDNVSSRSERTAWYLGPSLVEYLSNVEIDERASTGLRLSVQLVVRTADDARGYAGTIASGEIKRDDEVVVLPAGRPARVEEIFLGGRKVERAGARDAVMVTLKDQLDVARGDVLTAPKARPHVTNQFVANMIWMSEEHLLPGRSYLLKHGARTVAASVTGIKYRIDVSTLSHEAAKYLRFNDIGCCNVVVSHPLAFDNYSENAFTGGFIFIDRATNATVAAGMILHPLTRASTVQPQTISVSREARADIKGQKPVVLWFTGLPGAGKSSLANALEVRLNAMGVHTTLLDGDNVRTGISKDLGFTETDRVENIRRAGEIAKLMLDAGLVVLCAFISPFALDRKMVRDFVSDGEFVEIYVDAPLVVCIERDPKGLYKRAMRGEIQNFTGVDQAYEAPINPEVVVKTAGTNVDELADRLLAELIDRSFIRQRSH